MARAAAGRRGRGRRRRRQRRQARVDAEGQGTRAGGDDDGRRGRTLKGKGREPAATTAGEGTLTGKGREPGGEQRQQLRHIRHLLT